MTGSRTAFLLVTLVVLAALAALAAVTRADPGRRNVEFFTEMAYSRAYEAFAPNPHFPDGRTLQPLVPGVVPRGAEPFGYGPGEDEARRAGEELHNPLPAEAAARGAELFGVYCAVCHDARGNGKGPVVLRGMVPPPSLHGARAMEMEDGAMFHVLTLGQGNMKSYAAQLAPDERWAVIRHVRALQREGP